MRYLSLLVVLLAVGAFGQSFASASPSEAAKPQTRTTYRAAGHTPEGQPPTLTNPLNLELAAGEAAAWCAPGCSPAGFVHPSGNLLALEYRGAICRPFAIPVDVDAWRFTPNGTWEYNVGPTSGSPNITWCAGSTFWVITNAPRQLVKLATQWCTFSPYNSGLIWNCFPDFFSVLIEGNGRANPLGLKLDVGGDVTLRVPEGVAFDIPGRSGVGPSQPFATRTASLRWTRAPFRGFIPLGR